MTDALDRTLPSALHPEGRVRLASGPRESKPPWWATVEVYVSDDDGFDSQRVSRYGATEEEAVGRAVDAWNAQNGVEPPEGLVG